MTSGRQLLGRLSGPRALGTNAVLVVVVAALVLWWSFGGDGHEGAHTGRAASGAGRSSGDRLISAAGAFSVGVPEGLRAREDRGTAYLTSADRTVVILISRSEPGDPRSVNRRLVQQMRANYRTLEVEGSRSVQVDGRPGLSTYGTAVTRKGVRFLFVQTTVTARPRNLTVATFAEQRADPHWVRPRLHAVLGSLRVGAGR